MYLVDTNVVSAGAPSKAAGTLVTWMEEHSADLYMSAVSIAEIEAGIARLRRQGARRKADELTLWLDTLLHLYEERVLPFDVPAARIAGALSDLARSKGHAPGFADVAIAATAQSPRFHDPDHQPPPFSATRTCRPSIPSQRCRRPSAAN